MPALRLSRDFPYSTTSENKAKKKSNLIKGLVVGGGGGGGNGHPRCQGKGVAP